MDFVPHGFDGLDAVVEEEDLASTIHLAVDGSADDALIVSADGGLDWDFVRWCGVYGGHVPGSHECEVEGTGDGCGRECEEVDAGEEFFEFFFVFNSEALFFIYDGDS